MRKKAVRRRAFDLGTFLRSAGRSRRVVTCRPSDVVFVQGEPCVSVYYVQSGAIKLSVESSDGKGAVVAMYGPGDFFGEGCLAGQPLRIGTATALVDSQVLVVQKRAMVRLLHAEHAFSDRFIAHMLARNIRIEEDLVDHLLNSSEKRLARLLLLLARHRHDAEGLLRLPRLSQAVLAEMIGTTRSRVNFFMNKFRKQGLIAYDEGRGVVIRPALTVVLHS